MIFASFLRDNHEAKARRVSIGKESTCQRWQTVKSSVFFSTTSLNSMAYQDSESLLYTINPLSLCHFDVPACQNHNSGKIQLLVCSVLTSVWLHVARERHTALLTGLTLNSWQWTSSVLVRFPESLFFFFNVQCPILLNDHFIHPLCPQTTTTSFHIPILTWCPCFPKLRKLKKSQEKFHKLTIITVNLSTDILYLYAVPPSRKFEDHYCRERAKCSSATGRCPACAYSR